MGTYILLVNIDKIYLPILEILKSIYYDYVFSI